MRFSAWWLLAAAAGGFVAVLCGAVVWALAVNGYQTLASGMISTLAAIGAAGIAWAALNETRRKEERERERKRRQHFITMFVQLDDFRKTCISYIGDIDSYHHEMQIGKLHTSFPPLPSFLESFEVMSELDAERAVALYALRRTVMKESSAAGFYTFIEDEWSGSSHVQEEAADVARQCLDHLEAFGRELGWPTPALEDWEVEVLDKALRNRKRRRDRQLHEEPWQAGLQAE